MRPNILLKKKTPVYLQNWVRVTVIYYENVKELLNNKQL